MAAVPVVASHSGLLVQFVKYDKVFGLRAGFLQVASGSQVVTGIPPALPAVLEPFQDLLSG